MNANKLTEAFEPKQSKAIAVAIIALVGLTLAVVAFGVTNDHMTFAAEVVKAVSNGPVSDAVHSMYIK